MLLGHWRRLLEEDIRQSCEQMMREPDGILTHPYTVPSTPDYSCALWDWDSWLISAVLGQVEADTDTRAVCAALVIRPSGRTYSAANAASISSARATSEASSSVRPGLPPETLDHGTHRRETAAVVAVA